MDKAKHKGSALPMGFGQTKAVGKLAKWLTDHPINQDWQVARDESGHVLRVTLRASEHGLPLQFCDLKPYKGNWTATYYGDDARAPMVVLGPKSMPPMQVMLAMVSQNPRRMP